MKITLPTGKYVVAVSGGVDSVVLLDLLVKIQKDVIPTGVEESSLRNEEDLSVPLRFSRDDGSVRLVVAHFDHGIREDSGEDRRLVQGLAKEYGLPFVYHEGHLSAGASEAAARAARYGFLHEVRRASGAQAIITAHHQDDLLETAILNLLRGTGRRGLNSLKSTDVIRRPLLNVSKNELLRYAKREGLQWHEDSTNADQKYLRNYVRHKILPRFAEADREALLQIIGRAVELNGQIAGEMVNYLHLQPAAAVLDRHWFVMLPHPVAREIMAEWLLQNAGTELSKKLLERLVVAAKTGHAGSRADVDGRYWLLIGKNSVELRSKSA